MNRDHVLFGIATALLFTAAAWFGLDTLSEALPNALTESFVATMAVFINIVPFIVFMRARRDNAMRGVGITTMILALVVVFRYFL